MMVHQHIAGRKHRKFAEDDANFLQLDCVLARVKRRTLAEVEEEHRQRLKRRKMHCRRHEEAENPVSGYSSDEGITLHFPASDDAGWDNDTVMDLHDLDDHEPSI